MLRKFGSTRASLKQASFIFTFLVASFAIVSSIDVQEKSPQNFEKHESQLISSLRIKRDHGSTPEQHSGQGDADEVGERDKKVPRGFLGLRGKKAPSGFLGLRGRRSDSEEFSAENSHPLRSYNDVSNSVDEYYPKLGDALLGGEVVSHPLDLVKRAPSGFLGLRGKKAPSGFLGLRGKKAPSSFLGLRGKKAPSGFLGMRGKKEDGPMDYDDLESVLQALRQRYGNNQEYFMEDKRAPRGFLGLRGKKDSQWSDYDQSVNESFRPMTEDSYPYESFDKRIPSRFLGLRG